MVFHRLWIGKVIVIHFAIRAHKRYADLFPRQAFQRVYSPPLPDSTTANTRP